jgi:hypothetical protein
MPIPVLNRRHRTGLFLVLVAAGVSLFLEASAKQTAGAVVLGIAAAWAFGSLGLRMLGLLSCTLVCAVGLGILGVPVWQDWNSYQTSVQDYDSAIAELRDTVANAPVYTIESPDLAPSRDLPHGARIVSDSTRTVEIPEAARKWMRPGAIEKWKQKDSKNSKWVDRKESDWVNVGTGEPDPRYTYPADVTTGEMVIFIQGNDLLPRPEFSIRASLLSHRISSTVGFALALAGMFGNGLLLLLLRKSRSETRVFPA